MPEAQLILSHAVIYVATAPKSNASCLAIGRAAKKVSNTRTAQVPAHLRDSHYPGAGSLGRGIGYQYAHNYPGHYVDQQYLPDELLDEHFYEPTENGCEKQVLSYLESLKQYKNN